MHFPFRFEPVCICDLVAMSLMHNCSIVMAHASAIVTACLEFVSQGHKVISTPTG